MPIRTIVLPYGGPRFTLSATSVAVPAQSNPPSVSIAAPFAVGTFARGAGAFAGLLVNNRVLALGSVAGALGIEAASLVGTRAILEHWDRVLPILARLAEDAGGQWHDLGSLAVLAPVEPRQIFQCGANYRTHVIQLALAHRAAGDERSEEQVRNDIDAMIGLRRRGGEPYLFLGLPTAVAGPYESVTLPFYSQQHDWELELAAVIGRRAFRVQADRALDYVGAYTIANDLTTRDLVFRRDLKEIGTDWYRAKNAPGFLPLGPYLVPAKHLAGPRDLRITLRLNGETMQDESTGDMIFDVAAIVSAASQITPLLPGDLVLTGSPAGNGIHWGRFLRDGDVMEGAIAGLGVQRVRCFAERGPL